MQQFNKTICWLLVCCLTLLQTTTQLGFAANNSSTIAVVAVAKATSAKQEQEISAAVREAFSSLGQKVSPAALTQNLSSRTSESLLADSKSLYRRALKKLKLGRKSYQEANVDKAISELSQAQTLFRRALMAMEDNQGLLSTHLFLGMSYLAKGLESRGKEEIAQMVILDPKRDQRELSSKYYPPKIRKIYRQVKDQVISGQRGEISIKSSPAAKVFLDGHLFGNSPLVIKEVPVGEHFVVLKSDDYTPWVNSLLVVSGGNSINAKLEKSFSRESLREIFNPLLNSSYLSSQRMAFLDDLALKAGNELFVFLAIDDQQRLVGQLYDIRSQQLSRVQRASLTASPDRAAKEISLQLTNYIDAAGYLTSDQPEISEDNGLAARENNTGIVEVDESDKEQLNTQLPEENRLDQRFVSPLISRNKPGDEKQWYENWWLWGGIIGGLLLVGGGVLLFSDLAKSAASSGNITINTAGN